MRKKGFYFRPISIISILLVIFIGTLSFAHGILNGFYFGALDESRTFILWPLAYFIVFSTYYHNDDLKIIYKIFIKYIYLMPFIMLIIFFLQYLGLINNLYLPDGITPIFLHAFDEGRSDLLIINMNFIIFSSFLLLANFLTTYEKSDYRLNFLKLLVLISYFLLMIIAGRKAWYLCFFMVFILVFIFEFKNIKITRVFLFSIILVLFSYIIMSYLNIRLESIVVDIISGFDENTAGLERYEQIFALTNMIKESPIMGYGLGSFSVDSIRNIEAPWHYEMTYLKMILNVGVLGFLFYLLIFSFYCCQIFYNKENFRFYLYALFGYVIIASTNPYLTNFDMMWTIFVLIYLYNYNKLNS